MRAKLPTYLYSWILPALIIALFTAFSLTNGNLFDFFSLKPWGSLLYANSLDHIIHGNLSIDPQYAPGEYFVTGSHYVVYFGIMPVLIRGLVGLFFPNIYLYGLANLSMTVATLIALGSVWYAVRRLTSRRVARAIGITAVLGLLLASPLSYLLVWAWTYHEVILWGLAWALLFTSLYAIWVFDRKQFTRWHGLLLGLSVGMAMLCRPTIGLTLALPFAYTCARAFLAPKSRRDTHDIRMLLSGFFACLVLAIAVLIVNAARWGSPFTFVRIGQNVQFIQLYPDRREAIQKAGEFNVNRLPTSLLYYFIPTSDNISRNFPFVSPDRELRLTAHAPQYDYIEGSRVPLTMSMTYLIVLAVLGAFSLNRLHKTERAYAWWFLGGTIVTAGALLTVYAVALRYSAEFIPAFVFLAIAYVVALERQVVHIGRKTWLLLIIGVISVYITFVTTIAYKQFVWDVPPEARQGAQYFLRYTPTANETKHIINGRRYPVF